MTKTNSPRPMTETRKIPMKGWLAGALRLVGINLTTRQTITDLSARKRGPDGRFTKKDAQT